MQTFTLKCNNDQHTFIGSILRKSWITRTFCMSMVNKIKSSIKNLGCTFTKLFLLFNSNHVYHIHEQMSCLINYVIEMIKNLVLQFKYSTNNYNLLISNKLLICY